MDDESPRNALSVFSEMDPPMVPARDALSELKRAYGFPSDEEAQEALRSLAITGETVGTYGAILSPPRNIPRLFWSDSTFRQFDWERGVFKGALSEKAAAAFPGSQDHVTLYDVKFALTPFVHREGRTLGAAVFESEPDHSQLEVPARPGPKPDTEKWNKIAAAVVRLAIQGRLSEHSSKRVASKGALINEIRRDAVWKGTSPPAVNTIKPFVTEILRLLEIDLS
jgi:hypothetical protein